MQRGEECRAPCGVSTSPRASRRVAARPACCELERDRSGSCAAYAARRLVPTARWRRNAASGSFMPPVSSTSRSKSHPSRAQLRTVRFFSGALGDERGAALRARLGHRALPDHELAVRIRRAAEEDAALARATLDQLARAARLRARDAEGDRLGRLALRVAGARDELAEAPVLDHHRACRTSGNSRSSARPRRARCRRGCACTGSRDRPSTPGTCRTARASPGARSPHSGHVSPVGSPDLLAPHLALGAGEIALEGLVELLDRVDPLALALLDLVEVVLHLRRELDVHDVLEVRHELVGHRHAELGREQRAPLAMHVAAIVDDRAQDRRVGRRPADPELLEHLDQRGLGEARRRLGEVLLRDRARASVSTSPSSSSGIAPLLILLGRGLVFLAGLLVHGGEALELERRPLGAEEALSGLDVRAPPCRRPRASSGWPGSAPRSSR